MPSISTEEASSSSSFSSTTPHWKYNVFLSFRGEDTRNTFTDHLYEALKKKGIIIFRDEGKLEAGKSISLELLKAIEDSMIAVVIFSKNYAFSTWCLDELGKIVDCMKEKGMTVFPVFYDVDPSDVRKQLGTFEKAFVAHKERFRDNMEKVGRWKAALTEVANLKGWHLVNRPESKIIQDIVGHIWHKLSSAFSEYNEDQVGTISRGEKLKSCLAIGSNGVRIIGIWGMGGIGKTTLARVVFHMVFEKFESCCFLSNVRQESEKNGLVPLQKLLILQLLNESISIHNVDDGVFIIKNRLRHKRILLILDDVNQLDQLSKLAGSHIWFGSGSRIIITTRDKHLLQIADETYEIEGLNDDEALHLLSLKAFKMDHPPKKFLELSKDVVHYAKGLPLAIETLGSFLLSRGVDQWKSTLNRLREFPESAIHEKLKISYDGLHKTEQKIFLYIACFFNHESKNSVVEILDYLSLYPDVGLEVLVEKSLIKMKDSKVWMHDLLQEMCRKIVHEECPKEPGKRSKLWSFEDINNVLNNNTGTEAIEGIVLKLLISKEAYWNRESFSKMHHLELLIIENVHLLHDPKHLPDSLRVLIWSGYPSKSFPSSLHLKTFERLKFIQFIKSQRLIEIDLNKVPVLEKLVLEDCINLRRVHQLIGVHKKLIHLCIKGCRNLRSLPTKLEMESLQTLIISRCSKIKKIPEFGENMQHVLKLYLDELAITKLPTSIGHLTSLALLNIRDCKSLTCLPSTIFNLKLLKEMNISGCSKLEGLPEILGNVESVEELDMSGTAIREVPSSNGLLKNLMLSFRECKSTSWYDLLFFYSRPKSPNPVGLSSLSGLCSLTKLNLNNCNLRAIPDDIGCLFSLEEICLRGNSFVCLPNSISGLCKLRQMDLYNCTSLRSLPKLPLSIAGIWGERCISLETVPDLLKPNSLCEVELFLSNCSKLGDNQNLIDMFFAVIRKQLQGLSLHGRLFDVPEYNWRYDISIPGSVIPKWFRYQSMGDQVNIKEPSSRLFTNEWMGIAICVVFCSLSHHQIQGHCSLNCKLIVNGNKLNAPSIIQEVGSLDHIWLCYSLNQYYKESKEYIKLLKECEANEFNQIDIKIEKNQNTEVKKCGFRIVYKKDIEDLNQTMAQSSNNNIIPYDDLGVFHHNFNNSAVVGEGNIEKQTRDDYDGARPSGEGNSNDMPNPKRIERLLDFKTHGNFDCAESSE